MFPDLLPTVQYHGAPDWQFDFTNWQPRVSATYALGEKKTTLLRASYAQFADQLGFIGYYASGVPISNGYYYYWTDSNDDHIVQRNEIDFELRVLRLLQRHRSGGSAERPEHDPVRTSRFPGPTSSPSGSTSNSPIRSRCRRRSPTARRNNLHSVASDRSAAPGLGARGADPLPLQPGRRHLSARALHGHGRQRLHDRLRRAVLRPDASHRARRRHDLQPSRGHAEVLRGRRSASSNDSSDHWTFRGNFGWNQFKQYLTAASIQDPNNLLGSGPTAFRCRRQCGAADVRAPRPAGRPRIRSS